MPKKKKTPAVDPHEGRPTGNLTLGDFITVKVSQSQARKQNASIQQTQQPQQPQQIQQPQPQPEQPQLQKLQQQQPQQPQQQSTITTSWSGLEPTPLEATCVTEVSQDLDIPTSDIEELTIAGSENNSLTSTGASSVTLLQPVGNVAAAVAPPYFICRTKKGGLPVKIENRSSGKKVTLVEHVVGDGKALVQVLKGKFGTGGLFRDGVVELQGDCLTKVTKYFNGNKKLLRPYGTTS